MFLTFAQAPSCHQGQTKANEIECYQITYTVSLWRNYFIVSMQRCMLAGSEAERLNPI
jgi:hypothetical protein